MYYFDKIRQSRFYKGKIAQIIRNILNTKK